MRGDTSRNRFQALHPLSLIFLSGEWGRFSIAQLEKRPIIVNNARHTSYNVLRVFVSGRKEIISRMYGRATPSSLTAIMGPSGAGKTTLMNVLSGH